jgi:O-antigen ligase
MRDVMLAHVLGCAFLGILAEAAGRDVGARLDGVGGPGIDDSNTLGMYFATGAVVAAGLALTQRGWRRYLAVICGALILNGLVLANSRGAFLGLVAGMFAFALCHARQHRKLLLAFGVVGIIGMVAITDSKFIERMYTIQDVTSEEDEADTSARSRVAVAKAQLQMFADHPLGTGHRGTEALSPQYIERRWLTLVADDADAARSSHNTFLTALVEQGLEGAILYVALVIWIIRAGARMRRQNGTNSDPELTSLAAAITGALTVVIVSGNTADFLLVEVQFWMLALLASALAFKGAADRAPAGDQKKPAPIGRMTIKAN